MDGNLWSAADKDKIAALLVEGLSASQIAAKVGGSRNAIIGVIHRDKRLKSIGLAKSPGFTKPIAKPATIARRVSASRQPKPPFVTRPDLTAPASLDVLLHELGATQCKWPVNDPPRGGQFLFCGHERAESGPYCAYHHSRARRVDSVDR